MNNIQSIHDELNEFKHKSVYSEKTVDVIIPFYNESGNVVNAHHHAKKLEELFNINTYIYINNGSKDDTLSQLEKLKQESDKVKIINIKENTGYGAGLKQGFMSSSADFIMTNHADQQFDAYHFYLDILDKLLALNSPYSIFPQRKGRPRSTTFFTGVLRITLSTILGVQLKDFNGQPKLINKVSFTNTVDTFPSGFSFDLMLYLSTENKKFFPIKEQNREVGESSWNHGLTSKFHIFKSYISSALGMKKLIKQR